MHEFAQPEDRFPAANHTANREETSARTERSFSTGAVGGVGDRAAGSQVLEGTELDSALQLLVERAQYITGATGAALALPEGEEMVCRASAGSSAPAVGARLQVRSGLTGESIVRRQLLRCDNAEADPRVNLEACRALGIASIVVLPLLRRNGEMRGLFELFSDHPYAFEERVLVAVERMADLTLTALDLAEQRQKSAPAVLPRREAEKPAEASAGALPGLLPKTLSELSTAGDVAQAFAIPLDGPVNAPLSNPAKPEVSPATVFPAEPPVSSSASDSAPVAEAVPAPASVPEAMLRVQKCASCGFPVSEGRTLCLDCEKKDSEKRSFEQKQRERELEKEEREAVPGEPEQGEMPAAASPEEFVPAFLANAVPPQESWLANHVNLLAIFVLILGILVAVVVFR